jgi:hypothetical protein
MRYAIAFVLALCLAGCGMRASPGSQPDEAYHPTPTAAPDAPVPSPQTTP